MSMKAIVKSAISGDSLLLRGRPGADGQPPKERVLHFADVSAPRMGNSTRDDDPWAFESREYLRVLTVGKEVTFSSVHSLSSNDDVPRDLGNAELNGVDLSMELLKNGWAKLKDLKREPTEEDQKRKEAESEARAAGKGLWNPHGPKTITVSYTMPTDSQAFMSEWKGKLIDGIVEQVRDGSSIRVRLLMPEGEHQFVNIALAGVRCPRVASKQGETGEQWGEEAKFFTEVRLLQRAVKVNILSLPTPGASPFQASANTAAAPATIFIGIVLHPAGNVAEHLVANGLARVVDWHAGMLANSGGMERLRAAERSAKEKRACLYSDLPAPAVTTKSNGTNTNGLSHDFDAVVTRVWSGDLLSVVPKEDGKECRIQLSSVRAPKASDPQQSFHANEAREFMRKKLIGKVVHVHVDFVRPKEGEFEERECATVRYGGQKVNIAEQIIEKGLASVVRHRRDDEDRSSDYDKLMAAEQAAASDRRGIHSEKVQPASKPPMNLSESATRANSYLSGFKRLGKIPAVVEYVAAGSRFKVLLPKDNQSLTLVLAGIRAPRTARNPSENSEPFGPESLEFATRRYMQRDVEVEFDTTDKSGGFIGTLYVNKVENAAITLVREGLATVHSFSAENLPWAKQLYDAEAEAKQNKRNIWKDYDPEVESVEEPQTNDEPLKADYRDVLLTDIRTQNGISFSVQMLNTDGVQALEQLMKDFSIHYRALPATSGFIPKAGELVSAKFSADGAWYRAKIRRTSPLKKEAEVTFIDFGNQDTVSFKDIRPLDQKFRSLPGQAQDARLSFVKLVDPNSEYYQEAVERFRELCEGRRLVANIDYREGPLLHLRLMDPADSANELASINADLLREGLATIDRKGCKYVNAYPAVIKRLQSAVAGAKKERLGMFELGDIEDDD